jgi:hypothetical protein
LVEALCYKLEGRELRHYAKSWKVAGSITDEVTGFLVDLILPAALWP